MRVPAEGVYFDRRDEDGVEHARSYYVNGSQVIAMVAAPDKERPGKWRAAVRWLRRDKWHTHGWGPLDSEQDAVAFLDAVGIGVEAACGGATFLGFAQPESERRGTARLDAYRMCTENGWGHGQLLWTDDDTWAAPKKIEGLDPELGVKLVHAGNRYWSKTLPANVYPIARQVTVA